MTDQLRSAMRTYADTLEPPPLSDVLARAEQPVRSRRSGRLVLAAALVVAAVASSTFVITSLTNPDTPAPPAATQPTSPRGFAAPFCGPGMPSLDWSSTGGKQPVIRPGRMVAIPMRLPSTPPDRRLRTFTATLAPVDVNWSPARPVRPVRPTPESAVVELMPDQTVVTLVFDIPSDTVPGKYNVIGTATFPSPSLCGHVNPPDSTHSGTQSGGVGSVVIS